MNPDLEVDTDELRGTAAAVSATASRTTSGAARSPEPPPVPRWLTTDAAALAADAARDQLAQLGSDLAGTARRITRTAEAYELADARAATRLRLTR